MAPGRLCLLSFDGGGIRGLSSLLILRNVMEKLKYTDPEATDATPMPKPCDVFDMIGGTSTGGLIAVMLGRLKMSVDECIEEYMDLSKEIFDPKDRQIIPIPIKLQLRGGGSHVHARARYKAEKLEKAIKKVIKKAGLQEDDLLKAPTEGECKVFVCAAGMRYETVVLRSYRSDQGNDLLNKVKIWEACRATAAAPGYFEGMTIANDQVFSDGGLSDNNPIEVLRREASDCWADGPTPQKDLQAQLKCLISIGTGEPELKNRVTTDVKKLFDNLKRLATETRETADRFRSTDLGRDPRYFRLNVEKGVGKVHLDEWQEFGILENDTRQWCQQPEVVDKLKLCASALAGKVYSGPYATPFTLEGIPFVKNRFVDRPSEMKAMKDCLLPRAGESEGRNIYVLHGMGGVGKTQLAINFAQRHQKSFSSVFWLRSNTRTELHKSFFECRRRIPDSQIPEACRRSGGGGSSGGSQKNEEEEEAVVQEVLGWLRRTDNREWLIIFDNIDLDYKNEDHVNQGAFNVLDYMAGDHGSFIITTRLQQMREYGTGGKIDVVDRQMSRQIFERWYDASLDETPESDLLLGEGILGGLPSVIAGAAIYMRQETCSVEEYIRLWKLQQQDIKGVRGSTSVTKSPPDYDFAQGATWILSFKRVRNVEPYGPAAYEISKLWAYLDNTAFWHDLLEGLAYPNEQRSKPASEPQSTKSYARRLQETWYWASGYVQDLKQLVLSENRKLDRYVPQPLLEALTDELHFKNAMSVLVDYGLVNKAQALPSTETDDSNSEASSRPMGVYSMHSNVHLWARQMQTQEERNMSLKAALTMFTPVRTGLMEEGWAVFRDWLPHAEAAFGWTVKHLEAFKGTSHGRSDSLDSWGFYDGLASASSLFRATGRLNECNKVLTILEELLTSDFIESYCREDAHFLWQTLRSVLIRQSATYPRSLSKAIPREKIEKALHIALKLDPFVTRFTTWRAYNSLAIFYTESDDNLGEAERLLHELRGYLNQVPEERRGFDWKRVNAAAAHTLGVCLARRNESDAAVEELQYALMIDEGLGYQSGILGISLTLGHLHVQREEYSDAERLISRAYEGMVEHFGPYRQGTLDAAELLILVYKKQEKDKEAAELRSSVEDALEDREARKRAHEQRFRVNA